MLEHLDRQVFQSGEVVFQRGDEGDCAYLIEKGLVEILVGENGSERRISLLGEGELFGEIALVDCQPRTATVRALDETVLVQIQRSLVDELLEKTDPVIRHLLRVVFDRFRSNLSQQSETRPVSAPAIHDHHDKLQQIAAKKLTLSQDIYHALKEQQFELHYQPIFRLEDNRIGGFEALIRWRHPRNGMIPPLDFLGLAEQTGQIRPIGLWTLEQACQDWPALRQIAEVDLPFVSVNISANQLTEPSFAEDVKNIQQRYGMDPQRLKLELTETTLIERPELAVELLQNLRSLGNTFALDDFGTGYSGLSYLQRYPIGTLKLDRSFVSQIIDSTVSLQLVFSSIDMARALGLDVVAEGIETPEVRDLLLSLGCTYGQGWLFSKAKSLADLQLPAKP